MGVLAPWMRPDLGLNRGDLLRVLRGWGPSGEEPKSSQATPRDSAVLLFFDPQSGSTLGQSRWRGLSFPPRLALLALIVGVLADVGLVAYGFLAGAPAGRPSITSSRAVHATVTVPPASLPPLVSAADLGPVGVPEPAAREPYTSSTAGQVPGTSTATQVRPAPVAPSLLPRGVEEAAAAAGSTPQPAPAAATTAPSAAATPSSAAATTVTVPAAAVTPSSTSATTPISTPLREATPAPTTAATPAPTPPRAATPAPTTARTPVPTPPGAVTPAASPKP